MNDRTELIERAAERLREHNSKRSVGAQPVTLNEPSTPAITKLPETRQRQLASPIAALERHMTLDRAQLAQRGILMPWTTTARVVEEFRIIKRNILLRWQTSPSDGLDSPRVAMVTSARPREGKTFSSVNLALAFAAEENLTTILIDADTVRGDTSRLLKIPPEPGLIDVLRGKVALADALIQSDLPNLVMLPPGSSGPHVPELLAGKAPADLMAAIADRYSNHVIVMDTPPCLASTDATALAKLAREVVFVIEATHTQQSEVESALNLISGCKNISVVLNLVPLGAKEHFGSYSYYYSPPKQ
jgi:protein-tyrosine kinase